MIDHGADLNEKSIACAGFVDEATDYRTRPMAMHQDLHLAGFALTLEISDAPDMKTVFSRPRVKRVARLRTDHA